MITKVEIAKAVIEEVGNSAAMDLLNAKGYLRWLNGQSLAEADLAQ